MQRSKNNQLAEKRKRLAELKLRKEILEIQARIDTAKSFREQSFKEPEKDAICMAAAQEGNDKKDYAVADRVLELSTKRDKTRSPVPLARKQQHEESFEMPMARKKIRSPVRAADVPMKLSHTRSSITLPEPGLQNQEKDDFADLNQRLAALEKEFQSQSTAVDKFGEQVSRLDQTLERSLEASLEKRIEPLLRRIETLERNIVEHVIPSSIEDAKSSMKLHMQATENCLAERIESEIGRLAATQQSPVIDEKFVKSLLKEGKSDELVKVEEQFKLSRLETQRSIENQEKQLHNLQEENKLLRKQMAQISQHESTRIQKAIEKQVEHWTGKQKGENERLQKTITELQEDNRQLQEKVLRSERSVEEKVEHWTGKQQKTITELQEDNRKLQEKILRSERSVEEKVDHLIEQRRNNFDAMLSERSNAIFCEYRKEQEMERQTQEASLCESIREALPKATGTQTLEIIGGDDSSDCDDSSVGEATTGISEPAKKVVDTAKQFHEEYQYVSDVESSATSWSGNEVIVELPSKHVEASKNSTSESLNKTPELIVDEKTLALESEGKTPKFESEETNFNDTDEVGTAATVQANADIVQDRSLSELARAECNEFETDCASQLNHERVDKEDDATLTSLKGCPLTCPPDTIERTPEQHAIPVEDVSHPNKESETCSSSSVVAEAITATNSETTSAERAVYDTRESDDEYEGNEDENTEEDEDEGSEGNEGESSAEEDESVDESESDAEDDRLVGVDKLNIGNDDEVELRRRALALLGIGGPEPDSSPNAANDDDSLADESDEDSCDDSCQSGDDMAPHSILRPSSFSQDGFDWRKRPVSKKTSVSFSDDNVLHEVPTWSPEEKIHLFYDKVDINRFRLEDAAKKEAKANKEKSKLHTAIDSLPSFWG